MSIRQTIIGAIVCVLVAAFTAQSRMSVPLKIPRPKPGTTKEERREQIINAIEQRRMKKRKLAHEHMEQMGREAFRNELRVNEIQWQIIEPKKKREELIRWEAWAQANYQFKSHRYIFWKKFTEDRGGGHPLPKTPETLAESERIVGELIDLVRQEDPNDTELRQKIDALQQVREKARKEWPKARRELAAVLTTPRQEAVFLLMDRID